MASDDIGIATHRGNHAGQLMPGNTKYPAPTIEGFGVADIDDLCEVPNTGERTAHGVSPCLTLSSGYGNDYANVRSPAARYFAGVWRQLIVQIAIFWIVGVAK